MTTFRILYFIEGTWVGNYGIFNGSFSTVNFKTFSVFCIIYFHFLNTFLDYYLTDSNQ